MCAYQKNKKQKTKTKTEQNKERKKNHRHNMFLLYSMLELNIKNATHRNEQNALIGLFIIIIAIMMIMICI